MKASCRVTIAVLCAMMHLLPNIGRAQGMQSSTKQSPLKSFASRVGGDVAYVFTAPLRLSPRGGLKLLTLTAVTTAFVTLLDNSIDQNFIEGNEFYIKPARGLATVGEGYDTISAKFVLAGLSGTMLAGGLLFKDEKLLETTRLMVESFFITGAITRIAKLSFGRARPYTEEGSSNFDPFRFSASKDYRSFPSGHSSGAFAMMTVLAKQYDDWWAKIPAYALAVSVALQRIDSRNHWGADVIVGGAIGHWVGSTLVNRRRKQSTGNSINPYIFGNRVGAIFTF